MANHDDLYLKLDFTLTQLPAPLPPGFQSCLRNVVDALGLCPGAGQLAWLRAGYAMGLCGSEDGTQEGVDQALAALQPLVAPPEDGVFIWSEDQLAWWKADADGYTRDLLQAGVYSRALAEFLVPKEGVRGRFVELAAVRKELEGLSTHLASALLPAPRRQGRAGS